MTNEKAYKFALLAVLLWSTVATAFKISLEHLNPMQLVLYSSVFSTIFLYLLLRYLKKTDLIMLHFKSHFTQTLILGMLNPFLYYLILFKAYDLLPAQEAQAINYTWALMLAFLSVPILKHRLSSRDIIAGFICYFGVIIISTQGDVLALNFSSLEGVFYALLSTIIWALYWLYNTKNSDDPIVSLLCNFLISLPFIFIYYILTQDFNAPSITGLLGAAYVGLFEMGIAFVFWLKAMQYTSNTASISNLIFISPFLSLVFIHYFVGEEILLSTIVGLILIISGLLIQRYKNLII
ncbi:MAG: DMT family transporter [Campylobacterota bacterium]|nr:DMT family transporter [Campylobacterota bacterium]